MNVLLVRHVESQKNRSARFASTDGSEELTPAGIVEAGHLAEGLAAVQRAYAMHIRSVVSSDSLRSIETASGIAATLRCELEIEAGLASIGSGVFGGQSQADVWKSNVAYMEALQLYRAGLFNSYDIPEFEGKEEKREFERRVIAVFERVVARSTGDVVIVSQRSPITAILFECARQQYGFPRNYFGYVRLDLGRVSWLDLRGGRFNVKSVNRTCEDLLSGVFFAEEL